MKYLRTCCYYLTRLSLRNPGRTWIAGLTLTLCALVITSQQLELKTSNLDLVSRHTPEINRFMTFAETYGTPNVLIVVLEGDNQGDLERAADQISDIVRPLDGVNNVLHRAFFSDAVLETLGMERYIWNRDKSALYLFVQPSDPTSSAAQIEPLVREVRSVIESLNLDTTGIQAGLTGIPEYAVNDKDFIQHDLKRLSLLALTGILLVVVLGFKAWPYPLCAVVCLLCSAGTTLGLASIFPGHLTLLSASFVSILFGLGIDFGIHGVKRCEEELSKGGDPRKAIEHGIIAITPSLLTGALTTSLVFFGMTFSGLRGFAELGWIAGAGVLISMISMITLLPAGLLFLYRKQGLKKKRQTTKSIFTRLPTRMGWILISVTTFCAVWFSATPFDSDYLNLEPKDSEAVRLERSMIETSDVSPLFAVFTLPDEENAAALADRLYDETMIGTVRTLAGLRELGVPDEELKAISESVRHQFISPDGHWNVYAYPRKNLWNPIDQEAFVTRMREIHPEVTGMPFIGQYMLEQSRFSLRRVSWIALGILAVCLLLDFRAWRPALAAMLPTLMTFMLIRLFMKAGGMTFNPLNIMALPVILGIAVDDGVHLVHRYLEENGKIDAALRSTGKSIFLTTLTSLISFGCLGFAHHQGLASFGQLLALGITCSLAVTLLWLPLTLPKLVRIPTESTESIEE